MRHRAEPATPSVLGQLGWSRPTVCHGSVVQTTAAAGSSPVAVRTPVTRPASTRIPVTGVCAAGPEPSAARAVPPTPGPGLRISRHRGGFAVIGCICQRPKVRRMRARRPPAARAGAEPIGNAADQCRKVRVPDALGQVSDRRQRMSRRRCCRLRWGRAGSSDSKPSGRRACQTSSSRSSRSRQRPATEVPYARINVACCSPRSDDNINVAPSAKITCAESAGTSA